ncbi:WecB/TagA/CpsF family glycosyltransferase [Bacillus tianshenii]|uniref:WecB/TagA/CpsF family glycosyltransferase n=1 Tax=Sutcliffiella tianshenii TaxID=1463404 RepID=UPI001CD3C60E|nr:WecB/TagA/CpsF family glycosyltransferase [Bacillus tianshenii]MCA1320482.1 WecB/TagA/CpsF family glycosyltransferase [Bacillus tianshenii]
MKENYLGVDVSTYNYEQLSSILMENIDKQKKSFLVAINPEKIMKAQEDEELRQLLNRADYQIPDGIGVILASKLKKGNIQSRVTGIDMMLTLCDVATKNGKKIFMYGGKPGVADKAKVELEKQFPGIQIVGTLNGYEKDEQVIIERINEHKPDIIFVALGSPTQEYWIVNHMDKVTPMIFQGVGGSYDVISGNLKRAPEAFQKMGLEWFYRLIKEPWRFKRQLILPQFLIKVLKNR